MKNACSGHMQRIVEKIVWYLDKDLEWCGRKVVEQEALHVQDSRGIRAIRPVYMARFPFD